MAIKIPEVKTLRAIYGDEAAEAVIRYMGLKEGFERNFIYKGFDPEGEVKYFSAPGRTEIIGNHTDHNGGKILAASITMDTIAEAARSGDDIVDIVSEGYAPVVIDIRKLDEVPKCRGTLSLVAGILMAARDVFGYEIGGFRAYVTTNVLRSAGVSSSASYEMLLCAILNEFFNDGAIPVADYARIGQYSENHCWDKASGLMDQMACAVGGTIALDFAGGQVRCEKVDFGFDQIGMNLIIINTGKGHADLSAEYSSVPEEMRSVARQLGGENLCDVQKEDLLARLPEIRAKLGNDRALLRALHWYEECARVEEAVAAIRAGEKERIPELFRASGNSSWKWLQNCYVAGDPSEQSIPYALALAELWMKQKGRGVCRVHGGGFAGVIAAAVPVGDTQEFVDYMTPYLGAGNIHVMGIRQTGAVTVG